MIENKDIICFYGGDWWYHNPHSAKHIMEVFAEQNRILFVNSIGIRVPNLKNDSFAIQKILRKLKSIMIFYRQVKKNIFVLSPIGIPQFRKYENLINLINKNLLLFQIRLIMRILKIKNPILWVGMPTVKDIAFGLRGESKYLIYYCVDNTSYHPGANQQYISSLERELQQRADLALYVNHELVNERLKYNKNTFYIGHGVDYDHFAQAQNNNLPIPDDLLHISQPIIGYMGVIEALDLKLIKCLANRNKNYSFVFIGQIQMNLNEIMDEPNVFFLGKKPYEQLPNYLQLFSCCTFYYDINDVFNIYRNPKKLLEYMATGKPIVSVSLLEMEHFKEYIQIANTCNDFSESLRKAVYEDTADKRNQRISYAQKHTWRNIALDISRHMHI